MSEQPVDTYWGVSTVSESGSLTSRISGCAAKENIPDPNIWAYENRWEWASAPGWAAAYEYALAGGSEDPGKDPAVITDAMILTQVQVMLAAG